MTSQYAQPPPGSPDLRVHWPAQGEAHIVLSGEHDLNSRWLLEATVDDVLAAGPCIRVVVDVTAVDYLDSTLVNGLYRARRTLADCDVPFALVVGENVLVRRVLEVIGLAELLNAVDSVDASRQHASAA